AKEDLRIGARPRVYALGTDRRDDAGVHVRIDEIFAGLPVDEQRDRHAPRALAREHPIGPPGHHRTDAVRAAFRHPAHALDLRHRGFAERAALTLRAADVGFGLAER